VRCYTIGMSMLNSRPSEKAAASEVDDLDDSLSPEFREAIASVRLEGLEPSLHALELFSRVSAGELTTDQVRAYLIAHHRDRAHGHGAASRAGD